MRFLSFILPAMMLGATSQAFAVFGNLNDMLETVGPATPELNALINELDALSPQQRQDDLTTLSPIVDGSLRAASDAAMRQMLYSIADRQDKPLSKGIWFQLLGNSTDQKERDGVLGYDAYTLGAILGRDWAVCPNMLVGVAGGFQYADVDSDVITQSDLDIKRINGTLYGRYDFNSPLYAVGALTLAYHDYDSHRKIMAPFRIAHSEFHAWETHAYLETGYHCIRDQIRFTPKLSLSYSHLDPDSYQEHDAGALNLSVKYRDLDYLMLGLGGQLEYRNEFPKAFVSPEIHGAVFYDFIQDKQFAESTLQAGGAPFYTQGAVPAGTNYEVGAGFIVDSNNHFLIKIQYDFVARSDYTCHQAFIKLRHEWN